MKKIIITDMRQWSERSGYLTMVWDEERVLSMSIENPEHRSLLGNIYMGKIKNIVWNIRSAFVEILPGVRGYLPITGKENPKLRVGDECMVQVVRENVKTKQATLSRDLTLTGQYVALLSNKDNVSISTKITDAKIRDRLLQLANNIREEADWGCIVRTNAAQKDENVVAEEIRSLYALSGELVRKASIQKPFHLLYETEPNYMTIVRDCNQEQLQEVITDIREVYETLVSLNVPVRFYEDEYSLKQLYSLDKQISLATGRKVWLKSGGTLVIEPTEACTVIDVNTGKAIEGKRQAEETFFKINMQAADEIARQMMLRNLSGIIIVDFIDMKQEEHKEQLLQRMRERVHADPIRTVVVDMTPLGLIEITRKKVQRPFEEQWKEYSRIGGGTDGE